MINNSLIQINSNSKEQSARNSVTDANSIKKKPSLYQKKSFIFGTPNIGESFGIPQNKPILGH